MLRVGGWRGGFAEFDAEFKFAKIQNSFVEGGWVEGGFTEFDAEFKFAKIQNSYVEGGISMSPSPVPPPPTVQDWT